MKTLIRRLFLPVLATTLLLGTAGAHAAASGIQDDGAFFSEFAKVNATGTINDVASRLHKDIAIQTFATVPEDAKATVNQSGTAPTNRGFFQWAEQLAGAKNVNGVFILLVKQPAHLQVMVGTDTQKQAFTLLDRESLVKRMLEQLKQKRNDDALLDAVNFISTTMKSHRSSGVTTVGSKAYAKQAGGSSWLPTIGIVLLIWVGFSLVRGLFRSMSGGGGGAGGMGQPGYGGGGFMQNMMGSMFGAAAGMWMYDNFFGSHSSASSFGADSSDTSHSDGGYSGTDTDYTGSGGSFGDDSGGGGFDGGGDSGGGDFGGGGDF